MSSRAPFIPAFAVLATAFVLSSCDTRGVISDAPVERPSFDDGLEAPPRVMRKLTRSQYEAAIHSVFGETIVVPPTESDVVFGGLAAVGAGSATVSLRGIELHEAAAVSVARQVFEDPVFVEDKVPCDVGESFDRACVSAFTQSMAEALFLRPLKPDALDALVGLAEVHMETLGDFEASLEFVLSTLLQSPSFLFRTEHGTTHTSSGAVGYDSRAMASRLSYFLWGSGPDEWLNERAAAGALDIDAGEDYAATVDAMLEDPRAHAGIRTFFSDMLRLSELDTLLKDSTVYPQAVSTFGQSAREGTLRFIEYHVFETSGDYRDLLTSRETFVDPLLAIVYRVPAANLEGFGRVTLPVESRRRGLLGQASILALHSHAVTTSATLRGLFVRETLLCGEIPDPPPGVVTVIPEATGDSPTLRDRVAIHLQDPVCSSCHLLMDPIGLSLEQFDAIGQFRTEEGGAMIDASGTWLGRRFEDAADMTERLRNDPAFLACFPRTVFRYAMGRLDTPADEVTLEELEADFASQEYRVLDLFRAVATHPSFRVFSPNGGNP